MTEIYPSCTTCENLFSLVNRFTYQDEQGPVSVCQWNLPMTLENCMAYDENDPSVCGSCDYNYYWEPLAKSCVMCNETIDNCYTCSGNPLRCNSCFGGLDVFSADGSCWDSHCLTPSAFDNDTCSQCEDGYFLDYEDLRCKYSCDPDTQIPNNLTMECVVKCEPFCQYNDYQNPRECHSCDEGSIGIDHCTACVSKDFGLTLTCTNCDGTLVPDHFGKLCIAQNCA